MLPPLASNPAHGTGCCFDGINHIHTTTTSISLDTYSSLINRMAIVSIGFPHCDRYGNEKERMKSVRRFAMAPMACPLLVYARKHQHCFCCSEVKLEEFGKTPDSSLSFCMMGLKKTLSEL